MKNIYVLALFVIALFGACSENLFGSSAQSGKSRCNDKDLDCLQVEAEELFRAGKYDESYKTYQKIVDKDSNTYADPKRSVGYFGMAQAGLWKDSVTIFNFLGLSKNNNELSGDSIYLKIAKFFKEEVNVNFQNNYLQGTKKAYNALLELSRRDSLTELYNNFLSGKNDSLTNVFRGTYCSRNICKDALNKGEEFPLSDMKYRITYFSIGYAVSALLRTILGSVLFDVFGNGCIFNFNEKPPDPIKYGCNSDKLISVDLDMNSIITFGEDGEIQFALDSLYEKLLDDPALVDALNRRFEDLTGDVVELIEILGSITSGIYDGDGEVVQDSLQKQLDDFKGYTLFLRLGDGIDNDGDGCIDEELAINGKAYDTDGDGFFGEDLRIVPVPPPKDWRGCDNSNLYPKTCYHDEFIMEIRYNNLEGSLDTIVIAAWSREDGFWSHEFLSLEEGMARNELKKEIQTEKDKDGKTRCWPLAERQRRLGGCWRNYTTQEFIKYRNNPLQIQKGGMNPECKGIY